ncbi:hypothetical protein GDO78_015128 [Eleutherodactylus coqui]|uniref:Uncharacterized protein n=1 Tax=Eleutherodactylus coqui TaxID=57060 RepID=A0A8J6JK46_ELECQ|nr:hypothetical protein GDO78_015128 [Eleutherodactylus coqui]
MTWHGLQPLKTLSGPFSTCTISETTFFLLSEASRKLCEISGRFIKSSSFLQVSSLSKKKLLVENRLRLVSGIYGSSLLLQLVTHATTMFLQVTIS